MRLKSLLIFGLVALVGLGLGAGSALWMVARAKSMGGDIEANGWHTSPQVGAPAADPWTRALVARAGLLALAKSETIYFSRDRDDAGRPFSDRCTYLLEGGPLPARWWSITLYAGDIYLAFNQDNAASVDATRLQRDEHQSYTALEPVIFRWKHSLHFAGSWSIPAR
jgi:hypothetical protein